MNESIQPQKFADPQALSLAAAEFFVAKAKEAIENSGSFMVALSGGSTPTETYKAIAKSFADAVDWSKVHFFWSDERNVPSYDDQSNFRAANEFMISKLKVPIANIHRIKTEHGLKVAAKEYQQEIVQTFAVLNKTEFDLCLLGVGSDGHTASLFPGTEALAETKEIVVANFVPQFSDERVTFTYPLFNASSAVLFIVVGQGKAQAMKKIFKDHEQLPAAKVQATQTVWYADQAACAML